jgi:hypothetical protein
MGFIDYMIFSDIQMDTPRTIREQPMRASMVGIKARLKEGEITNVFRSIRIPLPDPPKSSPSKKAPTIVQTNVKEFTIGTIMESSRHGMAFINRISAELW